MNDTNRRLLVPIATVAGCLAFLLLLIVLATRGGAGDDNPAVGFPIVLVVLAVVAAAVGLGWRAVSRRKSSSRR